jgi:hypothetical protein
MCFGLYGNPVTHRRDMRSTTLLMGLSMMTTIGIDDPNHRQKGGTALCVPCVQIMRLSLGIRWEIPRIVSAHTYCSAVVQAPTGTNL